MKNFIWHPDTGVAPPREEIGGKAHALARLSRLALEPEAGFEVPQWFVIGAAAFDRAVREAQASSAGDVRLPLGEAVLRAELPDELVSAMHEAVARCGLTGCRVAVRSSAVAEDGPLASFAGQFDSVLDVAGEDAALADAVRRVWASAFGAHATAYRKRSAFQGGEAWSRMAVVVQEMAAPDASGVAFTIDPVSGEPGTVVVSAVPGLGEGLVSGELDADTYRVRIEGDDARVIERRIVPKERASLATGHGVVLEDIPSKRRDAPALSDAEAEAVARCSKGLERAFGAPQDVEWAIVRGPVPRLLMLQTRPVTTPVRAAATLAVRTDAARGERRIWDNSNIIESYAGVTTPLTFSFARAVYEDVYRQFCRVMGVRESLITASDPVFRNMLGLHRGRMYYNLLNWYRLLALLPGFSFNRAFMERMMGVRERLEDPPAPPGSAGRLIDLARLAGSITRVAWEGLRLRRAVPAFHARVEARLAPVADRNFATMPPDEIVALYRRLEVELLHQWRAPLVNDFFAMMAFGVLCRQIEGWLPDSAPTLANDLLCGEGGIISTEPARMVMALARRLAEDAALADAFAKEGDDMALWRRLHADPRHAAFASELDAYLRRFGDRCMNELKLETVTLHDDPAFLLRTIRGYALQGSPEPEAARERERTIRRDAEHEVHARLSRPRRTLFDWVTTQARTRVRDRENLRFERTRVFGLVRRMFLGLGAHLAAAGRLKSARDVFYLTVEELFADVEGTAVTVDLRELVRVRRAEFERWAREPGPPERFETFGAPSQWMPGPAGTPEAPRAELRGLGCCPGIVRAPVRIVYDPAQAADLAGHILVAERTDPGWTILFPAVRGLLVQRGSLLSHSAIVAREMGVPCVVGIAGLLGSLTDGETVEMDGATGVVRRLGTGS